MTAFRIGHGHDIHRVQAGGFMKLCGVTVARDRSFIAHSDGDVALHAIVDAMLGALGQGDIGRIFDNTDERWKDADSNFFLQEAANRAEAAGLCCINLDVTILAEAPKLAGHIEAMQTSLAKVLRGQINIKAGTNEGCDAVGRGEAIVATAVILLGPIKSS